MFRSWNRTSHGWFVAVPWWLYLVALLVWLVGFSAVFVVWLLCQPLRLLDILCGHRLSRALWRLAGDSPNADFSAARQQSIDRWGK
jgi:hypothetical protein